MWTAYKTAETRFWVAEDIDLSQDRLDWDNIAQYNECKFVSYMLALFAVTSGTILVEIPRRFLSDVQSAEARAFYGFQSAM
jgi:ribonucleoside-diphosphate reductase subunit M2